MSDVVDRGRLPGRSVPRLLAVCAVLMGLFLMHGLMSADDGCHDLAATAAAGRGVDDPSALLPTTDGSLPTDQARVAGVEGPCDSAPCVAIPPRERMLVAAAALVATLALAACPPLWRNPSSGATRRSPDSGRALLLTLCVART